MLKIPHRKFKTKYIDTFGYFSNSELKKQLLNYLPVDDFKSVLEIGSYEGIFTCFAAEHFAEMVHTIDPFSVEDEGTSMSKDTERNFLTNLSKCPNLSRIFFHKVTSAEFFQFNKLTFDFIYVDGSHEPRDAIMDLDMSLRALNPGGVLWIDDYGSNYKKLNESMNSWLNQNANKFVIIHKGYQIGLKMKVNNDRGII